MSCSPLYVYSVGDTSFPGSWSKGLYLSSYFYFLFYFIQLHFQYVLKPFVHRSMWLKSLYINSFVQHRNTITLRLPLTDQHHDTTS